MKKIPQSLIAMLMSSQLIANPYFGSPSTGADPKPFDPHGGHDTGSSIFVPGTNPGSIKDFDHGRTGGNGPSFDTFPFPGPKPFEENGLGNHTSAQNPFATNTENLIAQAIRDKKSIAPICLDHARSNGLQGINAFNSLNHNQKELVSELLFAARVTNTDSTKGNLDPAYSSLIDTPPPLKEKNDCNGGFELRACYGLLDNALNNRHQANFENRFDPNLYLEWLDLEARINPFDPKLFSLPPGEKPDLSKLPNRMPPLNQMQRDELLLDLSLEIISAIDVQTAYGNKDKVKELRKFLAEVNPSAAMAVDCILKDFDLGINRPNMGNNRQPHKIVGHLTGAVYESFDQNSYVGLAPIAVWAAVKGTAKIGAMIAGRSAAKVGTAWTASSPTVKAAIITAAGGGVYMVNENIQRGKDREIELKKLEKEQQKIDLEREKFEWEKQQKEDKGKDDSAPGSAKEAPTTEKSAAEKELEEAIKSGKKGQIKTIDDNPAYSWLNELHGLGEDYELAVIKSQYHFAEGENLTKLCDSVYDSAVQFANDKILQGLWTTISQVDSLKIEEERNGKIDYIGNPDWNRPDEKTLNYCGQVYLDGAQ
ncbi:MAG: hypothetical protein ACOH5I_15305 [Oligoflexus sp.]